MPELKVKTVLYNCPACDRQFSASQRKAADGSCPHCGIALIHRRKKKEDGPGFRHYYVVDEAEARRSGHIIKEEIYHEIDHDGPLWMKVERLNDDLLETASPYRPEYRVTFYNRYGQTECFCPRCKKYVLTSQVIQHGANGSVTRCKNKTNYQTCGVYIEFIFRQVWR